MKNFLIRNYSLIIYSCLVIIIFKGVMSFSPFEGAYPFFDYFFTKLKKVADFVLIILFVFCWREIGVNPKKIIIFFALVFFVAACKKTWLVFDLLFIPLLFSDYISERKVYKTVLYTILTGILLIFVLRYFSFFQTRDIYRNGVFRYSLGFSHPNALGFLIIICSFLISLLYYKKHLYITLMLLTVLVLFVYYIPNSVSSTLIIFLLMLSIVFSWLIENKLSLQRTKLIFALSLTFIFIEIVCIFYVVLQKAGIGYLSGDVFKTFVARIELANQAINEYGFSWLGQSVRSSNNSAFFVIDSAIFYLPIVVGLIPTAFFMWAFITALKKTLEKKAILLYCAQFLMFIYALSENYIITSHLSLFLFVLPFKENNSDEEKQLSMNGLSMKS